MDGVFPGSSTASLLIGLALFFTGHVQLDERAGKI